MLFNKKSKKKNNKIPKTVQQSIPYYAMYDNGIIETEPGIFTKSYKLQDINYQTAKFEDQQEMFFKYEDFLNSFDSSVSIQISIYNRNISDEEFNDSVLLKLQHGPLDEYINEYNQMLKDKMAEGKNNIMKDKIVTISSECVDFQSACREFARIDNEVISALKRVGGCEAKPLTIAERLVLLHDLYNPDKNGELNFDTVKIADYLKSIRKSGLTTKDIVGCPSLKFTANNIELGGKYAQTLYMKTLPPFLSDNALADLTDTACNMIISMNLKTVDQDKAIKLIKGQLQNINMNVIEKQKNATKNGYSMDIISPELQQAKSEADKLLQDVTGDTQKLFMMTFLITHYADSLEELKEQQKMLESIARKHLCQLSILRNQQEIGFNSSLPLCNNQVAVKRTLTTESTAIFMPFASQELFQKGGIYYGLNARSRNLITVDRTLLKNGNGFIFGVPGSGKSFKAKEDIMNILLSTNDDVIVIDPENEYVPLAKMLGGEVINIETGGKHYINPMDMDQDYAGEEGKDPIVLKSDFILSLCETIMSNNNSRITLSPAQISIIDRCVTIVYQDYRNSATRLSDGTVSYDQSKLPTLLDFQKVLKSQKEREAVELALALEVYTSGNLDNFSHYTNVDTQNRFLDYNIRDLGTGMQTLAMEIILDSVWNRVLKNNRKGKKTWVYIDESHLLVQNKTSAAFLRTLYKRGRKYNAFFTSITQNVEDFLLSDITRTMINNSEFVLLLNQSALDRAELAQLLNISDTQLSYITAAESGEGLIVLSQNAIIPFKDNFPTDTKMYRAMTSKPSDLARYKKEEEMKNKENISELNVEKKPGKELSRYEKSMNVDLTKTTPM